VTTEQQPATSSAGGSSRANGLGVGGFVTGLLSLLLGWLVPIVGVVLGVLGIVLGSIGRTRARRENAPTGLATAGVVLGAIGLVIAAIIWIAAIAVVTSS
jgi:heme/copper-type cytochrome/quinol oxidase subunit 2